MSNVKDFTSRMNVEVKKKHVGWPSVNFPLVQILVVVANIKVEIFKAEVEKGFMRTAIDHELVGPKPKINLVKWIIWGDSNKDDSNGERESS
jgi:hypothetical protein